MIGLYFEEIEIGLQVALGSYAFTADNIRRFSTTFVPVPFHMSPENAASGLFGATVAAGLHTCCAWMTCYVRTNTTARAERGASGQPLPEIGPSPGVARMRWPHPVHAGDVVQFAHRVTAKRELASRRGWGLVTAFNEGHNQNGELVLSFDSKVFVSRHS